MIDAILIVSILFLILSILTIVYRLVIGPTASDRVQALDALGVHIVAGVAIFSVIMRSTAFFEVILLIGILSFVGTIAFARFIERGVTIERDSD